MAGIWDVKVPGLTTTNLAKNPSFEVDGIWLQAITGTDLSTNYFTQTVGGVFGASYMHCETVNLLAEGNLYQPITFSATGDYTLSVYSRNYNPGLDSLYFGLSTVADSNWNGSQITLNASTSWARSSAVVSVDTAGTYYLGVRLNGPSGAVAVDLDAVQLESGTSASEYFDGDQPGCKWNGPVYFSTSSRIANQRVAGTWTDLTDLGVYVIRSAGLGIGDQEIVMNDFPIVDGGEVRQTRTPSRNFTLVFDIIGSSQSDLHSKRQTFINYLYARRYGSSQPCYIRYRGGASNIVIKAWYEGGLSFSHGGGDGFVDRTSARFLLESATLETETRNTFELTDSLTIGSAAEYNIIQRINGLWGQAGTGVNNIVRELEFTPQGLLYVGGDFTTASTSALTVNYIASFDGDTWHVCDSSGLNGAVYALESDPIGNVYVGGNFTALSDGTTERRRIGLIVYSSSSWPATTIEALGAGFADGVVYSIAYSSTSYVVAGGSFTSDSDATELRRLAKYDGDTWATVGNGFSDGTVYSVGVDPDGTTIYAAGTFTADTAGGSFLNHLAYGDTTGMSPMLPELADTSAKTFTSLIVHPSGAVYIGGYYDDLSNGILCKFKNGFLSLISDTMPPISAMTYNPDNGLFYLAIYNSGVRMFNGVDIIPYDYAGSGTTSYSAIVARNNDLYVGGDIDEATAAAYQNTVTVSGSGKVKPTLYILGGATAGTLQWIENQTTGQWVSFSLSILPKEIVTINFATGEMKSSYGRNLYSGILGGDFSTFELVSGTNTVAVYVSGDASSSISWLDREIGL